MHATTHGSAYGGWGSRFIHCTLMGGRTDDVTDCVSPATSAERKVGSGPRLTLLLRPFRQNWRCRNPQNF